MMLAKLEKIRHADPKAYKKITDAAKWAALIIAMGIVAICLLYFIR